MAARAAMARFLDGLKDRTAGVSSRCRRKRHALAEALPVPSLQSHRAALHVVPIGA